MCERGWLDVVTALLQRCQITMSLRRYRNAEAISSTAVPSTWWDGRTCTFVSDAKYSGSPTNAFPTPTSISFSPTPRRWLAIAAWMTRRGGRSSPHGRLSGVRVERDGCDVEQFGIAHRIPPEHR